MEIYSLISIVAVLLAPITAVWVGQILQKEDQKRRDKMEIFRTLMVARAYRNYNSDAALNLIEIVFADNKEVVNQWRKYYDKSFVENPTDTELKKIKDEFDKLLLVMAESLGYKDDINLEIIQKPYISKGVVDDINNKMQMQRSQIEVLNTFTNLYKGA